jgi:DNA-binding response OmpR family regulator
MAVMIEANHFKVLKKKNGFGYLTEVEDNTYNVLPPISSEILKKLIKRKTHRMTYQEITTYIWGKNAIYDVYYANKIKVHLTTIRNFLKSNKKNTLTLVSVGRCEVELQSLK